MDEEENENKWEQSTRDTRSYKSDPKRGVLAKGKPGREINVNAEGKPDIDEEKEEE